VCEIYQGFLKRSTKERQHFETKKENENISTINPTTVGNILWRKTKKLIVLLQSILCTAVGLYRIT
jgi:hypothetical protein